MYLRKFTQSLLLGDENKPWDENPVYGGSVPANESQQTTPMENEAARALETRERRRANREYMRQWRANPQHQAVERNKRQQRYYARQKPETVREVDRVVASGLNSRTCGFCSRPAVTNIGRLHIRDDAPNGYVEIRFPYCGQC
jgi:hypothetical protein